MLSSSCGSGPGRRTSLLAGLAVAVGAVLAVPSSASAQDETFRTQLGFVPYANSPASQGGPLVSFDISWVDSTGQRTDAVGLNTYYLADRSNNAVDFVAISTTGAMNFIGAGQFRGIVVSNGAVDNDHSGPNGIITFMNSPLQKGELWVGDAPPATAPMTCGSPPGTGLITTPPVAGCSSVKVFAPLTASGAPNTPTNDISTGGAARADELCFDSADNIVLVANDADSPPFVTAINSITKAVIGRIKFDGVTGNGPNATNGIEQCEYDPAFGLFLVNVPAVAGPAGQDTVPGAVVAISPKTGAIVTVFTVPIAACAGPQGMAVGPAGSGDVMLGCNAASPDGVRRSAIVNGNTGNVFPLDNQGGVDEAWFDPLSNHYFLAGGSFSPNSQLGIVDAGSRTPDQTAFVAFTGNSGRTPHSVAAFSGTVTGLGAPWTIAFVPLPGSSQTPAVGAPFSSLGCVTAGLVGGDQGGRGCIGMWATTPIPSAPED